ncbi:hypothetical protein K1719_033652 [Acacia pycnantha]|nr:hypothetical protein K1719_033652 [Acacia pycnantha]
MLSATPGSLTFLHSLHTTLYPFARNLTFNSPSTIRRTRPCQASLITNSESFEVGRLIGSYGFMNVTSYPAFPSGAITEFSPGDLGELKMQDIREGSVKIKLYEGRVSEGPLRGTTVVFKVYPGQRAGGVEADMMAANELNAHLFLQDSSKRMGQHLLTLVGGFETITGEQWLAFRDDGKYSAADYAKVASEKVSKYRSLGEMSSWNRFEQEEKMKRRRNFIIKLLQGVLRGLAFMHDHDRLHQSLGPSSVVLNTISEKEARYLIPRLRDLAFSVDIRYSELDDGSTSLVNGLWRRASAAGAVTRLEKRAFGLADDIYEAGFLFAYLAFVPFCEAGIVDSISLQRLLENTFQLDVGATREYCLADSRLEDAVGFLDLGNGAGWELLQAMLNPDFRKRPIAEAVLNHRFMNGSVL